MSIKTEYKRSWSYARMQARIYGHFTWGIMSKMDKIAVQNLQMRNHTDDCYKFGVTFYRTYDRAIMQRGGMLASNDEIPF